MQGCNHCCFRDARDQRLVDRHSCCDPQRVAIETSFAKKMGGCQNAYDCFLAFFRNDGELNLARLDVKNRVCRITLRKYNLVLVKFSYGFPVAHFSEKYLGIEFYLPTLLHESPTPWMQIGLGLLYSDSDDQNKYPYPAYADLPHRCSLFNISLDQRLSDAASLMSRDDEARLRHLSTPPATTCRQGRLGFASHF